jgi:hypothetical protein
MARTKVNRVAKNFMIDEMGPAVIARHERERERMRSHLSDDPRFM